MSLPLGPTLAAARAEGRKLLVAYVMAGSTTSWLEAIECIVAAGADAVEVGLPFSDPIIDGPTIQAAATASLEAGMTFDVAMDQLTTRSIPVPLIAMTYANVLLHRGYPVACERLLAAGCTGAIVPDLSLEELDDFQGAARDAGIETVLLAAPSTPPARLDEVCARSEGFVYAVGRMATTGEATGLDPSGLDLVTRLRARTTLPICLGIGVSTPEQAAAACETADGVVVGSAIVRRMLEGATPDDVGDFVRSLRVGISA